MAEANTVDFEKMFKISLTALRINGAHPKIARDKKWLMQFLLMHGTYTFVFFIVAWNVYHSINLKNYSDACRDGILTVVYLAITMQYLMLVIKQKTLVRIIEMMKSDFAKDMPEYERAIVFEYARKGRKVCTVWLKLAICAAGLFPAKHLFLELYTYVIEDWQLLQPYPLTYPSPIEENKQHPIMYATIYIVLMFFNGYGAVSYVSLAPLGPIFMLHACGQLEIVKKKAMVLYVGSSTEETEAKMKDIVKHMIYIYDFVDCINESYSLVYEFTLKPTMLILPITVFEVTESFRQGVISIEFISFIIGGLLICGYPCYYSDKLIEKGEEVRLALYSCGWEGRYDHGVRKTLVVTLLRALSPIAIRTMFQTMCLDTLADLFRQSYTIFNFINASWR